MNWTPLSVVIIVGDPKRATQCKRKESAQECAVISFMGMASGQRVNLSTIVSKYCNQKNQEEDRRYRRVHVKIWYLGF